MKAFTCIDLAAMRDAARQLRLGDVTMEENGEKGVTEVSVNGYRIAIETDVEPSHLAYVVREKQVIPNDYRDRPETGYREIARADWPTQAIVAVSRALHERQIDAVLEAVHAQHYYQLPGFDGDEFIDDLLTSQPGRPFGSANR